MIYIRWKRGEPRRGRTFPALTPDHPSYQHPCPECGGMLGAAERVVLIAVGPVGDDGRDRHDAGRWYSAGGVLAHETCVDHLDEPALDRLAAELVVVEP